METKVLSSFPTDISFDYNRANAQIILYIMIVILNHSPKNLA